MSGIYLVCVGMVALVVGFYWARVIKLVIKTRVKRGESAQFVPRERLGRVLRVIWYPTVGVWAVHPWVTLWMGAGSPRALMPMLTGPWLAAGGAAVAVGALVVTMVCWRRMGKSWRMGINPGEKTVLVVSGPWGFVAHPIYALSSLLMLASVVVIPSVVMVVAGILHIGFLQWEARREERHLVAVHGEVYAAYLGRVGRFVPRSLRGFTGAA